MANFRTNLKTERDVGEELFRLAAPLVYQSDLVAEDIIVPINYPTDFASIPQIFRSILPQNGKHIHAAVVHDYLCTDGARFGISQKLADEVFYEAMTVCGVRWTQRRVMFRAVRAFQRMKHLFSKKRYSG